MPLSSDLHELFKNIPDSPDFVEMYKNELHEDVIQALCLTDFKNSIRVGDPMHIVRTQVERIDITLEMVQNKSNRRFFENGAFREFLKNDPVLKQIHDTLYP